MKLRAIIEDVNKIALEQSVKNLQGVVLNKLRRFLHAIGLSTGQIKNSVIQPIPSAVSAYFNVKNDIEQKVLADSKLVLRAGLGSKEAINIGQKWGFQFPTDYYDIKVGQMGLLNLRGKFDNLLISLIRQTEGASEEKKIYALLQISDF